MSFYDFADIMIFRFRFRKARTNPKLYPVVVIDVYKIGKIGKRMKIHYVRYSERYEWRIAALLSSGWNLFVLLLVLLLKTVRG